MFAAISRFGPLLAGAAAALVVLVGCGVTNDVFPETDRSSRAQGLDPASTQIELRFTDSPVPPEVNRSYVILMEDATARVVVRSYDEVLHDERIDLGSDRWARFVARVSAEVDGLPDSGADSEGCGGGEGTELTVSAEGAVWFHIDIDDCGRGRAAVAAEAVTELMAPVYEAVDLETLIRTA